MLLIRTCIQNTQVRNCPKYSISLLETNRLTRLKALIIKDIN